MDFTKCFEILSNRNHEDSACPCCNAADKGLSGLSVNPVDEGSFSTNTDLQLLDQFLALQRKRVEVYEYFDEQLSIILQAQCFPQYPVICQKVTDLFSSLSSQIISVKEECFRRDFSSLKSVIIAIQAAEKDKLTLVAAYHLDQMRDNMKDLNESIGAVTDVQRDYLKRKIREVEEAISEQLEEAQSIKVDIMEKSS